MTLDFRNPALLLAVLGGISGIFGTFFLGVGYGEAPHPGIYMVLTGVWFGLVVGFGVWRWGQRSAGAAAMAVVATWIGWEAAVNLALQIDGPLLNAWPTAYAYKEFISGFAAGAVGAFITWAGVASSTAALRAVPTAAVMTLTGAVFGLLLPLTNKFDSGAVLLVPWQAAIAAIIGYNLAPAREPNDERGERFAIGH